MVSWVMLTLRAHPTTYHPSHSVPRRCSKYGPSSFRQKNKPEMCASTNSRIKDVRSPSHPTDRQSSNANLSQTSPKFILSWVERHLRQKSCWKKLQLEATHLHTKVTENWLCSIDSGLI